MFILNRHGMFAALFFNIKKLFDGESCGSVMIEVGQAGGLPYSTVATHQASFRRSNRFNFQLCLLCLHALTVAFVRGNSHSKLFALSISWALFV